MTSSISGLHYEENQVGSAFKSLKIEYKWEFILNGTSPNKIELVYSKLTGKKRLIKNGIEVFDKKNDGSFLKNFEIDGHIFQIIQYGEKFELRVDNQSFTHLYNLEKNKNFFSSDVDPTSKTQIADSNTGDIIGEKDENKIFAYNTNKDSDNKEKQGLFNFKIKVDENKANSGLKKFKFGPGIKSNNNGFNKNNKNENNANKDLLGFGDIIQNNDTNNSSSNYNNANNNDIFGLGIISNNDDNKQNTNNNNIFNFGNNNEINNNNNDFLNFDSNTNTNTKDNTNTNTKTTNEQLADIFNAMSLNNNSNNTSEQNMNNQNKENIQNNIPEENNQEINTNSNNNNNIFPIESSSTNEQNNFFNLNANEENKNNFGFFNSEQKNDIDCGDINYPKLDEINNQNNINNNNEGFSYNFVQPENNNSVNIEGLKPSTTGFDYEAFNNAKNNNQPKTSNDKLDNALKNLF